MMRRAWLLAALALVTLLAAALAYLTQDDFFLSAGSDAGVAIYKPALLSKLVALVLFVLGWSIALLATRVPLALRGLVGALSCSVLAFATHAVLFNHRRGVIEEFWLVATRDVANFDISDGVAVDWTVQSAPMGYRLRHKTTAESVYLFCGVPPWQVDPARSLR
jgi:hypothetical protein